MSGIKSKANDVVKGVQDYVINIDSLVFPNAKDKVDIQQAIIGLPAQAKMQVNKR